jgi:hypothetical protein
MSEVATGSADLANSSTPNAPFRPIQAFKELLSNPSFTIPIEANFAIGMTFTSNLLSVIGDINLSDTNSIIEPQNYNVRNTQSSIAGVLNLYEQTLGLIYATSINIPGEATEARKIEVSENKNAGIFLPLPVLNNRRVQTTFSINILETNRSFLDAYIRPWIIASSLYGLYTRSDNSPQNIKLNNLFVYQYDKQRKIRKTIIFNKVIPVSMESTNLAYGNTGSTSTKVIATSWLFDSYSITSY